MKAGMRNGPEIKTEIFQGPETQTEKSPADNTGGTEPLSDIPIGHGFYKENLIRLFYKKGEFIYARPNDIVMVESSDHLIKVYIMHDDKIKKTIRSNTLKDFMTQLPDNQFLRIGRFCAINLKRLSGGDFNQQSFEFDFKVSIKLKHPISSSFFNAIGK